MGKNAKLPVMQLELNTGVFRIKTEEAIYEITVKPESSLTQVVEKIVEREVVVEKPPATEQKPPAEDLTKSIKAEADTFYKEISEEMFKEIGKLARDLSLSIKDFPKDAVKEVDFEKAGVDLEDAKGLLEDVVKMTEKATMDIMDISENIQESCETLRKNVAEVKKLNFIGRPAEEVPAARDGASLEFLEDIIKREEELKDKITGLPVKEEEDAATAEPEPEPATKKVKVYSFDLDIVFQTIYELCTNETVKSHIKAMREDRDNAFDVDGILKAFSDIAPNVDVEENFFNFSLVSILNTLFQFSKVEKNKQILKKMYQTADSIFLDQVLPIEGKVEEKEVPVEKEEKPSAPSKNSDSGPLNEIIGLLDENIGHLKTEADRLREARQEGTEDDYSVIKKEDHEVLISVMESSDKVTQQIISSIGRILESLTFQDLSGQRIVKIVNMLTQVQIQLLSLLVSFGTKLKKKEEEKDIATWETDETASKEVDKMMSRVSEEAKEGEEVSGPLNQDAVDNLLAELGF